MNRVEEAFNKGKAVAYKSEFDGLWYEIAKPAWRWWCKDAYKIKEEWDVEQAYADGADIEFKGKHNNTWMYTWEPQWFWSLYDYRIKKCQSDEQQKTVNLHINGDTTELNIHIPQGTKLVVNVLNQKQ